MYDIIELLTILRSLKLDVPISRSGGATSPPANGKSNRQAMIWALKPLTALCLLVAHMIGGLWYDSNFGRNGVLLWHMQGAYMHAYDT
jgi:hypothetical protein